MQQGGGGATATGQMGQQPVESASPISSRPPASSNLEELMRLSEEGDRSGGGVSSGNRWPRQETLALLRIRSDMDAAFRDATVKGPLWEDVSRKLAEQGYKRNAKKCKEKFENVHKYYKRTKEGRGGRQDGKSYKFFSQLEALHSTTATATSVSMPVTTVSVTTANTGVTLDVAPVSIGIPMPTSSSLRIPPSSTLAMSSIFPPDLTTTLPAAAIPGSATTTPATATTTSIPVGISFSSNSSSSSPETEDDDDDYTGFVGQPSNTAGSSRKRKRQPSSSTHRMMDFFESLMKQVMQKQEAMQQRFLEVIEKREQDRMTREEAWKRQEMDRLSREHELMAQERAISASRDAAIISFLQKVTGQNIQLPTAAPQPPPPPPPVAPPQPPPPVVVAPAVPVHLPSPLPQERHTGHHQHQQQLQVVQHHAPSTSIPSDVVMAIPEQQIPPQESFEPSSSSRWPKVEVLALIKLRSGLEVRYQEAGPKGPLWEEISAGMHRMGYRRSSKRCKEKWENINKYFKKVKESNKKRPEDAKTCPYFHELDALYRKKVLVNTSGGNTSSINLNPNPSTNPQETSNVPAIMPPPPQLTQASKSENKNEATVEARPSLFGEGNGGSSNKPEDIVKELIINQQGMQQQQRRRTSIVDDFDKIEEPHMDSDSENMDQEEEDEDDDEDEELERERKMAYKVEFQRQNTSATNGGGNGAPSFFAMVQ
ncbi:hypothetical protein Ddye_002177 [Dipteronia dyeriana]|uniref:Myb-like domain-containing protein n=1 Tax=Dipteronia dyeriana TaxID=168575 RepID=A0AAD9XQK4_9ROSI|nr:hypothetical protein Ddye_002177 [Dipteronia dyeriana]